MTSILGEVVALRRGPGNGAPGGRVRASCADAIAAFLRDPAHYRCSSSRSTASTACPSSAPTTTTRRRTGSSCKAPSPRRRTPLAEDTGGKGGRIRAAAPPGAHPLPSRRFRHQALVGAGKSCWRRRPAPYPSRRRQDRDGAKIRRTVSGGPATCSARSSSRPGGWRASSRAPGRNAVNPSPANPTSRIRPGFQKSRRGKCLGHKGRDAWKGGKAIVVPTYPVPDAAATRLCPVGHVLAPEDSEEGR